MNEELKELKEMTKHFGVCMLWLLAFFAYNAIITFIGSLIFNTIGHFVWAIVLLVCIAGIVKDEDTEWP